MEATKTLTEELIGVTREAWEMQSETSEKWRPSGLCLPKRQKRKPGASVLELATCNYAGSEHLKVVWSGANTAPDTRRALSALGWPRFIPPLEFCSR